MTLLFPSAFHSSGANTRLTNPPFLSFIFSLYVPFNLFASVWLEHFHFTVSFFLWILYIPFRRLASASGEGLSDWRLSQLSITVSPFIARGARCGGLTRGQSHEVAETPCIIRSTCIANYSLPYSSPCSLKMNTRSLHKDRKAERGTYIYTHRQALVWSAQHALAVTVFPSS